MLLGGVLLLRPLLLLLMVTAIVHAVAVVLGRVAVVHGRRASPGAGEEVVSTEPDHGRRVAAEMGRNAGVLFIRR